MNNEINEILYNIEKISKGQCYPEDVLDSDDCKNLVNYITNLQERISKAIEYINENKHLGMFADCREPEEDWNYDLEINPRDLLNILKGDDKND